MTRWTAPTAPRVPRAVCVVHAESVPPYFGGCPAGWAGVGCDAATGRVVSLSLSGLPLACGASCALPSGLLTGLMALQAFNLSGTSFGGSFAALDFSASWQLEVLDLSSMPNFGGPLAADLPHQLPSLRVLNASGSGFSGPLPEPWRNLATLESLDLSGNALSVRRRGQRMLPAGMRACALTRASAAAVSRCAGHAAGCVE